MTEMNRTMMTTSEFKAMIDKLGALWSQNRAVDTVDFFSEDTIWSNLPDQTAYEGRAELKEAFANWAAKSEPSPMIWHQWTFSEEKQLGFCQYTFVMASKPTDGSDGAEAKEETTYAHGVLWMQMENKLIKRYREAYYYSSKEWDQWVNCYDPDQKEKNMDNP